MCFLEPLKETGARSRGNVFTNLKQEGISYELSKAHSEFSQISKFMGHSFTMFTKVGGFWWSRKVLGEEGFIFLIRRPYTKSKFRFFHQMLSLVTSLNFRCSHPETSFIVNL